MNFSRTEISSILECPLLNVNGSEDVLNYVSFDSRSLANPKKTIFVALKGNSTDGHNYIKDAYNKGVRDFIVSQDLASDYPDAFIFRVKDCLSAFQKLAQIHREKLSTLIIGITGSNGKTIVKEWLFDCLKDEDNTYRSPGSYNSQIGVAFSLLSIKENHKFAIIEAGISKVNEMENLERMIQPDVGIMTNIGDAHSNGFSDKNQKYQEKLVLFKNSKTLISSDKIDWSNYFQKEKLLLWGPSISTQIRILKIEDESYTLSYNGQNLKFRIPFKDKASIQNVFNCICALLHLQVNPLKIQEKILALPTLKMRLQLKEGLHNCTLLDDSYSFDLSSLQIALSKLTHHDTFDRKSLIISDLDIQNTVDDSYQQMAELVNVTPLEKLILIGPKLESYKALFKNYNDVFVFGSTKQFLQDYDLSLFSNELILIKGARRCKFDRIVTALERKLNASNLEINLDALSENIEYFKSILSDKTKLMAVIKATAYGIGSEVMASFLQRSPVDEFAVAIVDEAIDLRNQGIQKPILVLNPSIDDFQIYNKYDLQVTVSNPHYVQKLIEYQKETNDTIPIHIKLDTGMHRLGFQPHEVDTLISTISNNGLQISGIYTHLSSSDNRDEDDRTIKQIDAFDKMYEQLSDALGMRPQKHALNSYGMKRFPQAQYDMVRIGIGLYGLNDYDPSLSVVHTLKAPIIQIKEVKQGDYVGYGNKATVKKQSRIAIVGLGYADGLMRSAGNGQYSVVISGQLAPTIGSICMDLFMIDISHIEQCKEGDEVTLFGPDHPIENLADCCDTISYEILTRIAPRIRRVYIQQ